MSMKKSYPTISDSSDPRQSNQEECTTQLEGSTSEPKGRTNPNILWKPMKAAKPRALIVSEDSALSKEVELILIQSGFLTKSVKSMAAGCESARAGEFQVVVSAPVLPDGSWKRLADIDSHYRPGFVIILMATNFDFNDWGLALEEGAFEVLNALYEMPKVAEVARRALWAAYLKGAGPRPEALAPLRVS